MHDIACSHLDPVSQAVHAWVAGFCSNRLSRTPAKKHLPAAPTLGRQPSSAPLLSMRASTACSCGRENTVTSTCTMHSTSVWYPIACQGGDPMGCINCSVFRVRARRHHQVGRPVHQRRDMQHCDVSSLHNIICQPVAVSTWAPQEANTQSKSDNTTSAVKAACMAAKFAADGVPSHHSPPMPGQLPALRHQCPCHCLDQACCLGADCYSALPILLQMWLGFPGQRRRTK